MHLYLCEACKSGRHAECEIGHPCPPGQFGGSKCKCQSTECQYIKTQRALIEAVVASKERNPGVCGPCLAGSHLQCAGTPIVDQETGDLSCDDCACPKCRNMDKLQNKPDGKLNQQTKDENKVNRTMLRHTDLTDDVIRFVENSNPTQIAFRLQELMKSERSAKRNLRAIGIISTNEDLVMHGEKSAIEWMLGRPIQDPENSETESKPL